MNITRFILGQACRLGVAGAIGRWGATGRLTACGCMIGAAIIGLHAADSAEPAPPYYFTTLAGRASAGTDDGPVAAARFYRPRGVAFDRQGNLYVAESGNRAVRKITPSGMVSTVAGQPSQWPWSDVNGPVAEASFRDVSDVVVDATGVIYVAESINIRRIGLDGQVATLAGYDGDGHPATALADGIGSEARFGSINSLTMDLAGALVASDSVNNVIRKITTTGVVTTKAGSGERGYQDGAGPEARFDYPFGLGGDAGGMVYVADFSNHVIRKITTDEAVTTLAGQADAPRGSNDGVGNAARFFYLSGLAVAPQGMVYVSDYGTIRSVSPSGLVTTLAGQPHGMTGAVDGDGATASFSTPMDLAVDAAGNVYVADYGNNTIRKMTPEGVVTTLAGTSPAASAGHADGLGDAARFNGPKDVAIGPAGEIYIADTGNHVIRKVTATGTVTTYAGIKGVAGNADGASSAATFNEPVALAVDNQNNVYVADSGSRVIRKIAPTGTVSTLAGSPGVRGEADGTGAAAQFDNMSGLAVDSHGMLYVAGGRFLRQVNTLTGEVTTLRSMFLVPEDSRFTDVAVDANDDTLYGVFWEYGTLMKRVPGQPATYQLVSGLPAETTQLAVDKAGTLYFAGYNGPGFIGIINAEGQAVRLFTGSPYLPARTNGVSPDVTVPDVAGLAVDDAGSLYFASKLSNTVHKALLAAAPEITAQPGSQSAPAGGNVLFSVTALAIPEPTYQWYRNGAAIAGATSPTYSIAAVNIANAGDYTVTVSNKLGSVTSDKAALTVTGGGTSGGNGSTGGGGGGGAPSAWFVAALALLGVIRWLNARKFTAA